MQLGRPRKECYGLNMKPYSSVGPCLNAWSLLVVLFQKEVGTLEGGPYKEEVNHLKHDIKAYTGSQFCLSVCFLRAIK